MSLKNYIAKKNVENISCKVNLFFEEFLEKSGYAIYSLNFKSNTVFIENFLLDMEKNIYDAEEEANYINKLRFKHILDDKDILMLKENFGKYCIKEAEKTKAYLRFLTNNYQNIEANLHLTFDEKIFPEYNLIIEFNKKKYITSYRLNDVKLVFDNFLTENKLPFLYDANTVFYALVENTQINKFENYIKQTSWNLPISFPKDLLLSSRNCYSESIENCNIYEVKASINDVFVCDGNIHIINDNFIPKRIRWIKT